MAQPSTDFVGRGLAFPLQLGPTHSLRLVGGRTEIEQAIWLILSTSPGERPMRPDFGCALCDYVFDAADTTTAGHIAYEVRSSLERWEPRIDVEDVTVTVAEDEPSKLWVSVSYSVKGFYDMRSLVFPFYVILPEG
jgi:phage baseplate assembly protein W